MKIEDFDAVLTQDDRIVVIMDIYDTEPKYWVHPYDEQGRHLEEDFLISTSEIKKIIYKANIQDMK